MSADWTMADDEVLIDFVRAHEMLYNIKHKYYRRPEIKRKLWREVGEILNKTETDCYKRWCYVRDYYIRRKGKPCFGSTKGTSNRRKKLLSFLDNFTTSSNIIYNPNRTEESTEESSQGDTHIYFVPENSEETYQSERLEDIEVKNEGDSTTDEEKDKGDQDVEEDNKEKRDGNIQSFQSNLKRKYYSEIALRNRSQNELDETDLFFSSMTKIVKKLPRYEQARLRMEIGSLIGSAELRYIAKESARPSTSGT